MVFQDGQRLQKLDFDAMATALASNGVLSGLTVSYSSGLNIVVSSGTALINGRRLSFATTTLTVPTPHSTNPRQDLVYASTAGTIAIRTGTAESVYPPDTWGLTAIRPKPPSIGNGEIPLAQIWVPAGTTTLSPAWIFDKRHIVTFYREIEPRTSDPTGAELWDGRVWLRTDL